MSSFLSEYLPILLFISIGFALAIGMTAISFIIGDKKPDKEKLSAYECGFEAFDDARGRFDVRFYLVSNDDSLYFQRTTLYFLNILLNVLLIQCL